MWQLVDLVEEHGLEAVDAAFSRVDHGVMSPVRIVETIADLVLAPPDVTHEPALAGVDPAVRLLHLQRMVATYDAEGAEPPESILNELAGWQTVADAPQEVTA